MSNRFPSFAALKLFYMQANMLISDEKIVGRIYLIRGKKVMFDRHLAELYGVTTKALNQAVKRNRRRFPEDFMFQLTKEEFENWKSQIVTSNFDKMGLRKLPFAFTEQGVAMLSSVLNSPTAIDVNIQIIRVFTRMREMLLSHNELLLKLETMEKTMLEQGTYLQKHEEDLQLVFDALKRLLDPERPPMIQVGFRRKNDET